jgi:hypothetical protein
MGLAAVFDAVFNVKRLKRHLAAPAASMLLAVAISTQHKYVFRWVELPPLAISDVMRFRFRFRAALLALDACPILSNLNGLEKNRMA